MSAEAGALRWLNLWLTTGWLLIAAVVYLSLTPAPPKMEVPVGDKIGHVLAYSVLMFWFSQIYYAARSRALIAVGFVLLGITLEFLQGLGGERQFEVADMIANTAGVAIGWVSGPPRTGNLLSRIESVIFR
jgi:VanZ family protein